MKNKRLLIAVSMLLCLAILAGCSSKPSAPANESGNGAEVVENAPMQYMKNDELAEAITSGKDNIVILDVRKLADYEEAHIKNSVSADVDAAKEGDNESGIANLKAALKEATGDENGTEGNDYLLLCYSGKSYAQKATDLLLTMGVDASNIYTLEGGYKEWTASDLIE